MLIKVNFGKNQPLKYEIQTAYVPQRPLKNAGIKN